MANQEKTNITTYQPGQIQKNVDEFTSELTTYLNTLGLPSTNVLVAIPERKNVINNLPSVVERLDPLARSSSVYISKFTAACAVGLFDAALNFLWDETIASLREKASRFDLEFFFSSVVTDQNRRSKLHTAEDLEKLEDWELVRGCQLTGILSDIGFKHLDYIRDVRNWASAAHPNQNQLTGLQVVTWLETCIKEVIGKEPSGPAIQIRLLLENIRTKVLSSPDVKATIANVQNLSIEMASSLLRTIFGMYTDPAMTASAKNNIKLIAKAVWDVSPDERRYEVGLKFATFDANADITRRDAAREFLEISEGMSYLPTETLARELQEKVQNLLTAHYGMNNFYNETSHAKMLAEQVPKTGKIPKSIRAEYVKTLILCRIGNFYGLSWAASDYYDELISRFQEVEIQQVARLLLDKEVFSRMQNTACASRFLAICANLRKRATNTHTTSVLDRILKMRSDELSAADITKDFTPLLSSLTLS
ncbi:MAG: hypothetical protein NWE93_14715 [Candidatus Bathyarchaeota archaeon]|nr:hypothetical protein [Candidatus Bathyarchaeota archaeon]